MKFRLLNQEERAAFDEDFKHFLITNGVSNEEWLEMNETKPQKAEELVAIFSDTVFQKVMEKMKFLELRAKDSLLVFNCSKDEIELIGIHPKSADAPVDLSTPESIHESLSQKAQELQFFKHKKGYSKERELEVFEMIENGCVPSHEAFWMALNKSIQ
ncbi:hypothetical protein SAMN05216474_2721 [Lishizhenia tianjinensis]|uniref:Uncharacterized protein n=1 Tax=Lishizhenia tianjinensis TaxID=477690 RepID=A0A1I7BE00_9FLAO|nr:DUF6495 family protein [Lishizhenia tianjinensis]SFT85429.1 hypothetical protein SAMN05216474_2721 [Lishizhenia tianjinensis]